MDLGRLQRDFFDALYTYRIELMALAVAVVVVGVLVAWRRGWFGAARRHPRRATALAVVVLAVGLPLGWYMASPLFLRTELHEPGPLAGASPSPGATPVVPTTTPGPASAPPVGAGPTQVPAATAALPDPTPFAPRAVLTGAFHGTDDFHYGSGSATVIETAPGVFQLRFEDFSVRNGPDLYVYLSPDPADYADGALELGTLKATDGAFGYEIPAGTDPAAFRSAIIWCKAFSHLFAVAPLVAAEA